MPTAILYRGNNWCDVTSTWHTEMQRNNINIKSISVIKSCTLSGFILNKVYFVLFFLLIKGVLKSFIDCNWEKHI